MLCVRLLLFCYSTDNAKVAKTVGLGDKIKNEAQELSGKVKEATGEATDNERLIAEGQKDQVVADAKKVGEEVKDGLRRE
jgi:uncharacterized protein YjbJ (UPF0337 family)